MKKLLILAAFLFLAALTSSAQDERVARQNKVYFSLLGGVNFNGSPPDNLNYGIIIGQWSLGWKVNPRLALGAGLSLDQYNYQYNANWIMPFYLEGKYFLNVKKRLSYYTGLRAGMGPSLDSFDSYQGGVMVHPHLGLSLANKVGFKLLLEMGIKVQQQIREFRNAREQIIYNRFTIALGIGF